LDAPARQVDLGQSALRFFDLEGGRILIDGQDIATVTQESLRAQICVVTQDTSLLHRSIARDIRLRPAAGERGGGHQGGEARARRRFHP
jgi:ABC-type multidrug transport system fused ATPase/permease subunit